MTILSRNEQESIALQFEREYGSLIMSQNCGLYEKEDFNRMATALSEDIRAIARIRYFEEDMLQYLDNLANSIQSNIASTYNSYQYNAHAAA